MHISLKICKCVKGIHAWQIFLLLLISQQNILNKSCREWFCKHLLLLWFFVGLYFLGPLGRNLFFWPTAISRLTLLMDLHVFHANRIRANQSSEQRGLITMNPGKWKVNLNHIFKLYKSTETCHTVSLPCKGTTSNYSHICNLWGKFLPLGMICITTNTISIPMGANVFTYKNILCTRSYVFYSHGCN